MTRAGKLLAWTWLALVVAGNAMAQTNERAYEEYGFRFVAPGARAVGMGGAFVGLADDATAAFSNPAGLSNLLEPEFSIEFTGTRIRNERPVKFQFDEASVSAINTVTKSFGDQVAGLSFLSYVQPIGDFTFSVFRQQLQDYRERFVLDEIRFSATQTEDFHTGNLDIRSVNWGIGLSYVTTPHLSIGISAVITTVDAEIFSQSGQIKTSGDKRPVVASLDDSDIGLGAIVGLQYKPSAALAFGATYYTGSTLEMTTEISGDFGRRRIGLPSAFEVPPGYHGCTPTQAIAANGKPLSAVNLDGCRGALDYVIPSRLAAGVSWRPTLALTLLFDAARTNYSEIVTDNFLIVDFNGPRNNLDARKTDRYFIEDATEFHLGGEYKQFKSKATYTLRAGVFTEQSHSLRARLLTDPSTASPAEKNEFVRFTAVSPSTRLGVAAGFGFYSRSGIQLDGAVSFGRSTSIVLSSVVRLCPALGVLC